MNRIFFKAKFSWGAALDGMTVEQAGHFIKALYAHVQGLEYDSDIPREIFLALQMAKGDIDAEMEHGAGVSKERAKVGSLGGKKKKENAMIRSNCYKS